ncbi:MAG: glycine cleavage system aminomethyltransferase GcvT [Gammaproteobacteria bacterium]|nr:glycine cleavage system aminomethyltransferase GcvT [Gammaproteobacteria bacterium]
MVDFHGWLLPLHYGSQLDEHHRVRQSCGLFDVSHMTVTDVAGPDARSFLRILLANDVARLSETGQGLYSCMLNPAGGVIDDLVVYRLGPECYRVISNSATRQPVLAWMQNHLDSQNLVLNTRDDLAMVAIQGPDAAGIVARALPDLAATAKSLSRFHSETTGARFLARTGYTGEDGFELLLPGDQAVATWQALVAAGARPTGLGARDTLRLEAGLCLYGQDLDIHHTPLESGLGWTLNLTDPQRAFNGRTAIERQQADGAAAHFTGVVLLDRGVLRAGQILTCADGRQGQLTSGGFSPTLQHAIGFARLPATESATTGSVCTLTIRGQEKAARLVKLPFIRNGKNLHPELIEPQGVEA